MNTKLTLRLDEELIESAKKYADRTGRPVSRLVADLFQMIKNEKHPRDYPLTPTVRSLKGALRGNQVSEEDYRKYLEEKHR